MKKNSTFLRQNKMKEILHVGIEKEAQIDHMIRHALKDLKNLFIIVGQIY